MSDCDDWEEEPTDDGSDLSNAYADDDAGAAAAAASEAQPQVWSLARVAEERQTLVDECAQLLGFSQADAALVLQYFKWDKIHLQERFFDDPDRLLREADVAPGGVQFGPPQDISCRICFGDLAGCPRFAALRCGHWFCSDCWGEYLGSRMLLTPLQAVGTRCPQRACTVRVGRDAFLSPDLLHSAALRDRYIDYELRCFVEGNPCMRWCPGAGCDRAVLVKENDPSNPTGVDCHCGCSFCFSCGEEVHCPCSCRLYSDWLEKERGEEKTGEWMAAHTKPCPKCRSIIEKNGGCNRVTCQKCGLGFCWMCGSTEHYACNVYNKTKEMARDRARQLHDMYMFYYDRYRTHALSKRLETRVLRSAQERMRRLQAEGNQGGYVVLIYLEEAAKELAASRHVLKHTYPYAYFLRMKEEGELDDMAAGPAARSTQPKKRRVGSDGFDDYWKRDEGDELARAQGSTDDIRFADQMDLSGREGRFKGRAQGLRELFELNQAQLEENVEKLSEMLEDQKERYGRQQVVDQTGLVRSCRKRLREGIFDGAV
eukprot:TRINITY_DN62026_c0_g1_i1.p1 TRINITY_DN62026_c0_g1~~TRINITY_DN62026_c0_g1_i1.p1  ORF type:complete len:542 (+),score=160.80 TRINITY_DN62026_c0_g1_i1:110-1735(+)